MLVNETKTYNLKINGEEIELRLDFNALIKMHKEYGNAFLLIHDFVYGNDLSKLPCIIKCMASKEISEDDVKNMMISISTIDVLSRITLDLLDQELVGTSEFEVKSEVVSNGKKPQNNQKKKK